MASQCSEADVVARTSSSSSAVIMREAPERRAKKQPPQQSIDEFWSRFTTKTPGKPFTILPDNFYAKRLAAQRRANPSLNQNAVRSYEEAVQICKEKVAKIVSECRRVNQKYRDMHFDIEADFNQSLKGITPDCLIGLDENKCYLLPKSVKRIEDIFQDPQFFVEGATANDVRQGKEGDCWLMSALCTLSNMPPLIEQVCCARDEQVGVYGFVFHRDGEWISEVIDDKLYLIKEDFHDSLLEREKWLDLQNRKNPEEEYRAVMQTGSRALYFAQCSDPNETWLPLLEKAYAKAHGDYNAISGGFVGEGIEDLTGGVTTEVFGTDILDKEKFWKEELCQVNKQFLFGCAQGSGVHGKRKGIIEQHAYSIMDAIEMDGERLLKLRNPWGNTEWSGPWSDGSEQWTAEWIQKLNHKFGDDGVFWISYKDLLRNYQHFDRTRLFVPENPDDPNEPKWKVTQLWTSLNIPWSVDYHDTKFTILLKGEPGVKKNVVIVLSQLDDRYFKGLQGEYEFKLQFRLHREAEEDYIVRSPANYYMRRSVSTEVDLEPGAYSVLLKIVATRYIDLKPVEEVIRKTCRGRRDKLLSIGLSYDLAHAKGQFKESEKERKEREAAEKKAKRKMGAKAAHAARRQQRLKQKLRQKRRQSKMEEKRLRAKIEGLATPASMQVENGMSDDEAQTSDDDGETQGVAAHEPVRDPPTTSNTASAVQRFHRRNESTQSLSFPSRRGTAGTDNTVGGTETPRLQVNGLPLPHRKLSLSDISDDDLSWDSELDAPDSDDSDPERGFFQPGPGMSAREGEGEEGDSDDEFAQDPWNAVCVVGLRVYSKGSEVEIKVLRPGEGDPGDKKEKLLDVDDSAADATKDLAGLEIGLEGETEELHGGTEPVGVELDRQG
ncbi:hypothetical protein LTR66_006450 [Elasticomyces elasticus]|nr:hypothetical protein LTR28_011156 [Elasticomyces elasticus]KAK4991826.1 hypothetical protein LTR66_006450 [Elasticomyces elasticus]